MGLVGFASYGVSQVGLIFSSWAVCIFVILSTFHGSRGALLSSASITSPIHHQNRYDISAAASPKGRPNHATAMHHSRIKGPVISPASSNTPAVSLAQNAQGPYLSPVHIPSLVPDSKDASTPSPSTVSSLQRPNHPPMHSPSQSFSRRPRAPWRQPANTLPPPSSNLDCRMFICVEPLTNTPPGSPCACVLPIKVVLRVSVALYTFFSLVSELAGEIASGIFLERSQVRIMGANASSGEPETTIVLINLVPRGEKFDNDTAYLTYEKFWHKQISIKASLFGDCEVLYVVYPGLPHSPPTSPARTYTYGNNAVLAHPFASDVKRPKAKHSGTIVTVVILSSVVALVLCVGAALTFLFKHRDQSHLTAPTSHILLPPFTKISGTGFSRFGSRLSTGSASLNSGITACIGSTKPFTLPELVKATNKFSDSRIIGEGGFGRVYEGTLEDGTCVAVKVLKREDQQGTREFLAEVEMLSRLHHRNLVKLIGICTEGNIRCLIYELVPNGSVESHLYGMDKETAPLNWNARMKIALDAARCLAYLHEDSNPHVIHRDFKSSNILLEHDFTPKLCDFGLARTAMGEENEHISTRVMGTFGYVAPEYAMTGHLLVKSDVYSYGVVLLELLTGRKPVDMLRPAGQENLVTWARPLLTSKEGLETIIDPEVGPNFPFENFAKVAAIASLCVQSEVSQRPFMGEVVQALKLVRNESSEHGSVCCSQEESSSQDIEIRISRRLDLDEETVSTSDMLSMSARFTKDDLGSYRRHSSSGPLRTGRRHHVWQWVRGLSRGSVSEHGFAQRQMQGFEEWP